MSDPAKSDETTNPERQDREAFDNFKTACTEYQNTVKTVLGLSPNPWYFNQITKTRVKCDSASERLDSSFQRFLPVSRQLASRRGALSVSMPYMVVGSYSLERDKVKTFDDVVSQFPANANRELFYTHCQDIAASLENGCTDFDVDTVLETATIYSKHNDWAWSTTPVTLKMVRTLSQPHFKNLLKTTPRPETLLEILNSYEELDGDEKSLLQAFAISRLPFED